MVDTKGERFVSWYIANAIYCIIWKYRNITIIKKYRDILTIFFYVWYWSILVFHGPQNGCKWFFLVVLLYMWAWIGKFLLLYLICYYICDELSTFMTLKIWHFCRKKTQIHYFCRKIIKYGISVAKISTYALPGQILEEITNIFDLFNAWKISR